MKKAPLYLEIVNQVIDLIDKDILKSGDRVPSIRKFSHRNNVSINTIKQAYSVLETRRIIEARPQSGYFVCPRWPDIPEPEVSAIKKSEIKPTMANVDELYFLFMKDMANPELINLSSSEPNHSLLPKQRLSRILSSEIKKYEIKNICYMPNPGLERLRKEIAKLYIPLGLSLSADDIFITGGCVDAITISLLTLCKPGDTVAMVSPFFPCSCLLLRQFGINILEIPSHVKKGLNIKTLEYVLEHNSIQAVFLIPNFSNPLGSLMPDDEKKQIIKLLESFHVPVIEDDIFGELYHKNDRPSLIKGFDKSDSVILCSSFSKTLVPGYRIGWAIPGRFKEKFEQIKIILHNTPASCTQLALAEFLANGGYERHLRKARRIYANNVSLMADAVHRYFPEGTRTTKPEGGYILWIMMPENIDSVKLYENALGKNISIAPGLIFTSQKKYKNCFRLNAADWSAQIEHAIISLGNLAKEQMDT